MNQKPAQSLEHLTPQTAYYHSIPDDDNIDLRKLFFELWKGKWLIICTTLIFSISGVLYSLSLPNLYKAEVVLASSSDSGKGGMAAMADQFGGLASLAGINLGGSGTDNKAMALAVLNSRQFINYFIHKHDLLITLMASNGWDKASETLKINPEIYNVTTKQWVSENRTEGGEPPSDWLAYKAFHGVISTKEAKNSGLITLSVEHFSPVVAQNWAELLVKELNFWMKEKSLNTTKRNIGYLEQQLEKTNISDMRSVFFQLIEEQTKNLMLAEVETEFAFKTIDPAVVPEEKSGPKRAIMCVFSAVLGFMLGVVVVVIRTVCKKQYCGIKEQEGSV